MKEHVIKLLQIIIIYATVVFLFINFQSKNKEIETENLNLEKQKFEWSKKEYQYLIKVDSLENHISSLEVKKKENLITANKKKNLFRELTPTEQVVAFNNLFNTLTKDEQK